jgi:hypothetical protein
VSNYVTDKRVRKIILHVRYWYRPFCVSFLSRHYASSTCANNTQTQDRKQHRSAAARARLRRQQACRRRCSFVHSLIVDLFVSCSCVSIFGTGPSSNFDRNPITLSIDRSIDHRSARERIGHRRARAAAIARRRTVVVVVVDIGDVATGLVAIVGSIITPRLMFDETTRTNERTNEPQQQAADMREQRLPTLQQSLADQLQVRTIDRSILMILDSFWCAVCLCVHSHQFRKSRVAKAR